MQRVLGIIATSLILTITVIEQVPQEEIAPTVYVEPIPIEEEVIDLEIHNTDMEQYYEILGYLDKVKSPTLEWMEAYEELNSTFPEISSEFTTLEDLYSKEDIQYLYRCVETETRGADIESKSHVAKVILNRVNDDRFPNTIKGVVTQPNQFCYSCCDITEETIVACKFALFSNEADGCYWFRCGKKTTTFSGGDYVFTDDVNHHFFG